MAGPATSTTSTPVHSAPPARLAPSGNDTQQFDTVLRGYERRQVDEFVGRAATRSSPALRDGAGRGPPAAPAGHRARRGHRERAARAAGAARRTPSPRRSRTASATGPRSCCGWPSRRPRRSAARPPASRRAIIEQARTEAEKHRHEVEQSLIARASLLEQQAAQRTAELQEREQQISDQLAAAREQADQLHATAVRAADRLREESEAAAEETKAAGRDRRQAPARPGRAGDRPAERAADRRPLRAGPAGPDAGQRALRRFAALRAAAVRQRQRAQERPAGTGGEGHQREHRARRQAGCVLPFPVAGRERRQRPAGPFSRPGSG